MRNHLYSVLFLLLFPFLAEAGVLKGKVTDNKGAALPFVTVYIQGTTIGTTANAQGEYELPLEPGKYKVVSQVIGFKQSVFSVTITGNETIQHNFELSDQDLRIKEVVVKATDEDPAYRIIRKAIARRSFHLKQMKSFQTGIYLKGTIRTRNIPSALFGIKVNDQEKGELGKNMGLDSNGKGVLFVFEEDADYYTQLPDKKRTVIHSVRESGDPNGLGVSEFPEVISFYENNINLSEQLNPRGFVSPIADNALLFYKYKLLGEYKEDGRLINKIQVTPRRQYEPTFTGIIYIVDEDWAIQGLDMTLTKKSNMDFLDTFRVSQLYLPLRSDVWVIKSQVWYPTLTFMGFDFTGNFATVYNRQKVNESIPDTMFAKKLVSSYDKTANKKDTSYWTEARPIPLEKDEVKNYVFADSVHRRVTDPKYIDSMRRVRNRTGVFDPVLSGYHHDGKGYKWSLNVSPLLFAVNFNTVEGLNIAPKISARIRLDSLGNSLDIKSAVRYGFSNTHFNGIARIAYVHNSKSLIGKRWDVGVRGGKYVFQFNPHNPMPPLYNTISTLFYEHNDMKIYERWDATAFYNKSYGNGLKWSAGLSYQQRLPLENTSTYSWRSESGSNYSPNTPTDLARYTWEKHDAVLAAVSVSYQPGFTYTQYPDYKMAHSSDWPVFTFTYTKGIPNVLNSKTDFDKWRFGITGDARLKLFGSLSYNLAAGGFLNDKYVSLPDLMHIDGDQTIMAAPYMQSFQLANYYRYSNTEKIYGEAHIEYYLKGLLTNKIPLLRQARWYFVLGNNTFYANQNFYHTEAFIGIDNLGFKVFRVLRVDYVHSWDGYGKQYDGIRFGIKMGQGINVDIASNKEEFQ